MGWIDLEVYGALVPDRGYMCSHDPVHVNYIGLHYPTTIKWCEKGEKVLPAEKK